MMRPAARKLEKWAAAAKPGERCIYAHMRPSGEPDPDAMAAAMRLYEAGAVLLVQRREPDGSLSYIAQKRGRLGRAKEAPPEPEPSKPGAKRKLSAEEASRVRSAWRAGADAYSLADRFDVSHTTVWNALLGLGTYAGDAGLVTPDEIAVRQKEPA